MEVEINKALNLSSREMVLLDMHSFLNVMNVLIGELLNLQDFLDNQELLTPSITLIYAVADSLSNLDQAIHHAHHVTTYENTIIQNMEQALPLITQDHQIEAIDIIDNVKSIFAILKVRAQEILTRTNRPNQWIDHDIEQLKNNFINVFGAIERNSKGRYRIVYNVAQQETSDYFVNLQIDSVDGKTIRMPPVLQDVMRDLLANARKYTQPSGSIHAGLHDDGQTLHLVVKDNGRGIPADQIEKVVEFGVRGSNAEGVPSKGGGFGLTKAYFVTKQFGGRLWIESSINAGTKITISIPKP